MYSVQPKDCFASALPIKGPAKQRATTAMDGRAQSSGLQGVMLRREGSGPADGARSEARGGNAGRIIGPKRRSGRQI